jgi:hypothetical protein
MKTILELTESYRTVLFLGLSEETHLQNLLQAWYIIKAQWRLMVFIQQPFSGNRSN